MFKWYRASDFTLFIISKELVDIYKYLCFSFQILNLLIIQILHRPSKWFETIGDNTCKGS